MRCTRIPSQPSKSSVVSSHQGRTRRRRTGGVDGVDMIVETPHHAPQQLTNHHQHNTGAQGLSLVRASAKSRPLGRCGHPRRDRGLRQRRSERRRQGWRGAESSGAPHAVLGLDDKPLGAILPDHLGGMACASQRTTRRAPREAQRGHSPLNCPPDGRTSEGFPVRASL